MERKEVIVSEQELARQKEFTRKMREMNDRRTRTPLALVDTFGCQQNVADGEVLGLVELPIAGLMNDLDAPAMSEKVHHLEKTWAEIGCTMPSPFMTMALIPLACLPELRLTNRGLVDCTTFQFVDLVVDED